MAQTDPNDFLAQLKQEFVQEVGPLLEDWEETILALDHADSAVQSEAIATAFRIAHSIKGSAGAIGLAPISEFGHKVEDCLSVLRSHPDKCAPGVTSVLLRCGDAFKSALAAIRQGVDADWSPGPLVDEVIFTLTMLKGSVEAPADRRAEAPAETPVEAPGDSVLPAVEGADRTPPARASAHDRTSGVAAEVIRMDPGRLDALLDLVGELVVIKSQMIEEFAEDLAQNLKRGALLTLFDRTVRDLQERALGMRLTALKPLFVRMQRVARDTASRLGKRMEILLEGEEMEIDRSMIEQLTDPLMHLVRNAIDHGIETSDERAASGKPAVATVRLRAHRSGGRLLIEVKDDGKGVHREKVLGRAVERGLIPAGVDPRKLSDREVFNCLFKAGFSTAEVVTDISGRGVGLDVVRSNVEKLKGTIDISSRQGEGTTFTLSLPLTTAITDGIVVRSRGVRVVIPLDGVREFVCLGRSLMSVLDPIQRVVRVREEVLPWLDLGDLFQGIELKGAGVKPDSGAGGLSCSSRNGDNMTLLVIEAMGRLCAIRIEAILGQAQVVTKPLPGSVSREAVISGTAVMGDGVVALVLDVNAIPRSLLERAIPEATARPGEWAANVA